MKDWAVRESTPSMQCVSLVSRQVDGGKHRVKTLVPRYQNLDAGLARLQLCDYG